MATGESSAFGTLLKHYRRAAALTQETLAERSGLSARGIGDLERGEPQPPRRDCAAPGDGQLYGQLSSV